MKKIKICLRLEKPEIEEDGEWNVIPTPPYSSGESDIELD